MKICRETGLRMSPHNPSVTPKSGNGSRKESNVIHLTLPKCIFKHFIQTEYFTKCHFEAIQKWRHRKIYFWPPPPFSTFHSLSLIFQILSSLLANTRKVTKCFQINHSWKCVLGSIRVCLLHNIPYPSSTFEQLNEKA